jgi:predicted  nucleic acid-binding Zn-ribbon protein
MAAALKALGKLIAEFGPTAMFAGSMIHGIRESNEFKSKDALDRRKAEALNADMQQAVQDNLTLSQLADQFRSTSNRLDRKSTSLREAANQHVGQNARERLHVAADVAERDARLSEERANNLELIGKTNVDIAATGGGSNSLTIQS